MSHDPASPERPVTLLDLLRERAGITPQMPFEERVRQTLRGLRPAELKVLRARFADKPMLYKILESVLESPPVDAVSPPAKP